MQATDKNYDKLQSTLESERLIQHDDSCFAMLNFPTAIRKTQYEGSSPKATLRYYRSLVNYNSDLLGLTFPAGTIETATNAVDDMIFFYDLITQHPTPPLNIIIANIIERSQNKGHCYFPSGWLGDPGHFAGMKFKPIENNQFIVSIVQQGSGSEFHRPLRIVGTTIEQSYQSEEFRLDFNTENGQFFLLGVINLSIDQRVIQTDKVSIQNGTFTLPSHRETITPFGKEDLYALMVFYGEPIKNNNPNLNTATRPQMTGTCSVTSIEAVVRDAMLSTGKISIDNINQFEFVLRHISIIEAVKEFKLGRTKLVLLQWALREYDMLLNLYGVDILSVNAVRASNEFSSAVTHLIQTEHDKQITLRCSPEPFPAFSGEWITPSKIPVATNKKEQDTPPKKTQKDIPPLKLNGCKPQEIIGYLDQAIDYFKTKQDRMQLMELRDFMHSLSAPSAELADNYWDQLEENTKLSVIVKLNNLIKMGHEIDQYNNYLNKDYRQLYNFEISLIAYDIAAQLAPRMASLSFNNRFALTLDDVFTDQVCYHDVTSYHTIKKITANFLRRAQNTQPLFGHSINYSDNDATQDYVLNVLLTSEKKRHAIQLLKDNACLGHEHQNAPVNMLFKAIIMRSCEAIESGKLVAKPYPAEQFMGEFIYELIALSVTTHSLGQNDGHYGHLADENTNNPKFSVNKDTKFHREFRLKSQLTHRQQINNANKALYELEKHYPKIPTQKTSHLDFAENTIYHPMSDLAQLREQVKNEREAILPYELKPLGLFKPEWSYESLPEELDEDLRAIACTPSLQVVNTLEWAKLNIDKLTNGIVRQRLSDLLFSYAKLDIALADNTENTHSQLVDFFDLGFNTYSFDPDDPNHFSASDTPNQLVFLWLCQIQHSLRRYVELSAKIYQTSLPSHWPNVRALLLPQLERSLNHEDRTRVARIIFTSYEFESKIIPSDIPILLISRLVLQMNPYTDGTMLSKEMSNELDYSVESVWLKHRKQICTLLINYSKDDLSTLLNRVYSTAIKENINAEWQMLGDQIQSLDQTLHIDLISAIFSKDHRPVRDKTRWINGMRAFSELAIKKNQVTLIDNGYVTFEGKPETESSRYGSVMSTDKSFEFLYYTGNRNVYATYRYLTINSERVRLCLLLDNEGSYTSPAEHFQKNQLNNPFEAFANRLDYQYWYDTATPSRVVVMRRKEPTFAYVYSTELGWQRFNYYQGIWKFEQQVLLDLSQPRTQLEQAWANRLQHIAGLHGIKVEGILTETSTCQINTITFNNLNLSFQRHEERLESIEFPGYFLSTKRSIKQLNGLATMILLENDQENEKILVPAFALRSFDGNAAFSLEDITTFIRINPQYIFQKELNQYYQYRLTREGDLRGDIVESNLYLAILYRSQGDYKRAASSLMRTYHHYNNDQELRQIAEQLTQRQDLTPLGAAFDSKVMTRMVEHTKKLAKKADVWLGNPIPDFIEHALVQYQYYAQTFGSHREGISIVPDYLRLSTRDIEAMRTAHDFFSQKKNLNAAFDDITTKPNQKQVYTSFTFKDTNLAYEKQLYSLENTLQFNSECHRRTTDSRPPFLRIYYDPRDDALNQLKVKYEKHISDQPALEYLKTHFIAYYESAISKDAAINRRLCHELFLLSRNDLSRINSQVYLISLLAFVAKYPQEFRDLPRFDLALDCFTQVTKRAQALLTKGFDKNCVIADFTHQYVILVDEPLLPNINQKTNSLQFDLTTIQLPPNWDHPLGELVTRHFDISSKMISDRPFPLVESGLGNCTNIALNLFRRYRSGHEQNQRTEKRFYAFSNILSATELRSDLQTMAQNDQHQLQLMQVDIERGLTTAIQETRESYLLESAYRGEQLSRPTINHLMKALLKHDVTHFTRLNYFLNKTQVTNLLGQAVNYALLQCKIDQISEVLSVIKGPIQLLGQTVDKIRNYNILEYPEFLVYEFNTQRMIRPDQATVLLVIINHIIKGGLFTDTEIRHALLQFPAGGGKTAVILNILAQIFARLGLLPFIVNTNELYQIGVQEIPHSLGDSFQQGMEVIERGIDYKWSQTEMEQLLASLKNWRADEKCVLITDTLWHALLTTMKIAYANKQEALAESAYSVLSYIKHNAIKLEDEGHLISDPLQESIKTYGPMQTIPVEQQELFLNAYDYLMGRAEGSKQIAGLAGIANKSLISVNATSLQLIREQFIEHMAKNSVFDPLDRIKLKQYLYQEERKRPYWLDNVFRSNDLLANSVVLVRAFAHTLLPHILTLQYKKDYGASIHFRDITVAPKHDAKDVTSHFSDQILVMALTIQFYEQQGIAKEYIIKIIQQLQLQHRKERKYNSGITRAQRFINTVLNITLNHPTFDGLTQGKIDHYTDSPQFSFHPKIIKHFLRKYALPQIKTPKYRVISTPAHFQAGFKYSIMVSATPGLRATYPGFLKTSDCFFDTAFESQVIDTLLKTKNEFSCLLDMTHSPNEFVEQFQSQCPQLYEAMTTLIDRGALLSNHKAQQVIEAILEKTEPGKPKANAAYFDEQSMVLRSLNHDYLNMQIPGTRIQQALQRYGIKLEDFLLFLFIDLIKTTGLDVKRPFKDRAGVTVGKEQTVTEIIQAVMRERQLLWDDAQTIIWLMFKSLYSQVHHNYEIFDPKKIFYWMIHNEAKQISTKVVMRAYQFISQQIEDVIWEKIHRKIVLYATYENRLQQSFDLTAYHRYELESVFATTEVVLQSYVKKTCEYFSLMPSQLPNETQVYLRETIQDTAQLIELMRQPHGAELNTLVIQEQNEEIQETQETVQEELVKTLFDQSNYFEFNLEVYDVNDQLTAIFNHDSNTYQLLTFPSCKNLQLPPLRLRNINHSPLKQTNNRNELPSLKPIRLLLVQVKEKPEFVALSAAGGEYFHHEIQSLNTQAPHEIYAIIGLDSGILSASKTLSAHQRLALLASPQLQEMLVFLSLLNGQYTNLVKQAEIAQRYRWTKEQYECLYDRIAEIHVSRHLVELSRKLDHNLDMTPPIASQRSFPVTQLTTAKIPHQRVSALHYISKPTSALPDSLLYKNITPAIEHSFAPTKTMTFYDSLFSYVNYDDINIIEHGDEEPSEPFEPALRPPQASAASKPQPFPFISTLFSWFQPEIPSALPPEIFTPKQPKIEKSPYHCESTWIQDENDWTPTNTCNGKDYQVTVFPKIPTTADLSTHHNEPTHYYGDSYKPSSCRPIEHHGKPSVACDGDHSTLIYTPTITPGPLDNLYWNIQLGRVLYYACSSTYQWFTQPPSEPSEPLDLITEKQSANKKIEQLQQRLTNAEDQLKSIKTQLTKVEWNGYSWGIEDYQRDMDGFMTKMNRGKLTQSDLEEFCLNIDYLCDEISEVVQDKTPEQNHSTTSNTTEQVTTQHKPKEQHYPKTDFFAHKPSLNIQNCNHSAVADNASRVAVSK